MSAGASRQDVCPFAARPDATGCDCDCTLPRPKGFLAALAWWLTPSRCTSGAIGEGSGRLPCWKYDKWRKEKRTMNDSKPSSVEAQVRAAVADQLYVKPEMVTDDADFADDFGADTLDFVEITMWLEERFGIVIPDLDADRLTTFARTMAYLRERGVA